MNYNKVEIYSATGELVLSKIGFNTNIKVEALSNGVYFVKVFSQTKNGIQKFIKQ